MTTELKCPKCGVSENESAFDEKFVYEGEYTENGQKLYCSAICPCCKTNFEYTEVYEFKGFEDIQIG